MKWLFLCALAAASCTDTQEPDVQTVLSVHPEVLQGAEIERGSEVWTRDRKGSLFMNGKAAALAEIRPLSPNTSSEPVLIEIPPGLRLAECTALLEALIGRSRRNNIGFLVSTPAGFRTVLLPIPRDMGPPRLWFTTGRSEYKDEPAEKNHLLLRGRAGSGGGFHMVALNHAQYSLEPAIWFPDPAKPDADRFASADLTAWTGEHPPLGLWSEIQTRDFLASREIQSLSPFVILEVAQEDLMDDFLKCLDMLHRVAPGRTVVHMAPGK